MRHRLRVLVVDDDPHVRSATVRLLNQMGHAAAEAEDGPAGLVALRHARDSGQAYDLVITNTRMPVMSGFEFIDRVLNYYPHQRMLRISSDSDDRHPGEGDEPARVPFLNKPFTQEELAEKVLQVAEQSPPR